MLNARTTIFSYCLTLFQLCYLSRAYRAVNLGLYACAIRFSLFMFLTRLWVSFVHVAE